MTIFDLRYQGFQEVTDEDLRNIEQTNNIRTDAILVRTSIGGAVWIDPSYPEVASLYSSGQYKGDESAPAGVLFVALPFPPVGPPVPVSTNPSPGGGSPPPPPYNPPPGPIQVQPNVQYIQIRLSVYNGILPVQKDITVNVDVLPAIPEFDTHESFADWTLEIRPIPLPLRESILTASRRLLRDKIQSYFDQDRIGKTLLNFGEDYQTVLLNWMYDFRDNTGATVFVKLYRPLPTDIELFTESWIVRELSPSYLDQVFVIFVPGEGLKVYLRPPNRALNIRSIDGNEVNDVTLQSLLTSGSSSKTNLTDPIVEEWYVTSLEGAELNIDYANYKNFVFYSSAVKRLEAFKQKLLLLEDYNSIIVEQSQSIAAATSGSGLGGFTGSLAYAGFERISEQRMDLIRSFDGYERFLYYGSGSAYSASFSDDGGKIDQLYYLSDATWPKVGNELISVASASNNTLYSVGGSQFIPDGDYDGLVSWWDAITYIAEEYDRQNQDRLVNNLPSYLVSDDQSSDFITFVDMIGHHFDVIKMYADAMPNIYDRNSDPTIGLSPDMVWTIAKSFGIDLPNQYAVKQLVDYTIGEIGAVSPTVYRQIAVETWKRFLHNQIYLLKSKGTKSSLRGLLNSYGVLPTTIQIRESSTPSFYTTQSYELIEEQTNTLNVSSGEYIQIPFSGSTLPDIQTVQVRFASTTATQSVIFNVDAEWGLVTVPFSGTYGRTALIDSTGSFVVSSSLLELYSGNYYTITVQQSGSLTSMWTHRADDDGDIIDTSLVSSSVATLFNGSTLYLGSTGSAWGTSFIGNIDEFRMWSELLTMDVIQLHVQYPGLYNGNTTTSARDQLPVRLSFNKPRNLGSTPFVLNESPYIREIGRSPLYNEFSASGFSNESTYPYSMDVITRNVLRYAPNTGGSQFVSNKITIADPPVFRYLADDANSGVPVLSHESSMVSIDQKFDSVQSNNVIGFYFSPIDAVNDSITRTIGNIDLQDYIGNPADIYQNSYTELKDLNKLYWTYYAYTFNYNSFIDFVENLLQPLFIQAKQLVPARAKLLTGIVLESHILERNKIKWRKIDTSGYGTFEETVTPTFYPDALSSQPSNIVTDYPVHYTTVEQDLSDVIDAEYGTRESIIDTSEDESISATYPVYDSIYDLTNEYTLEAASATHTTTITTSTITDDVEFEVVSYDDETARLNYLTVLLRRFNAISIFQLSSANQVYVNQLMSSYKSPATIQVFSGMNQTMPSNSFADIIEPYVDFSQIGSIEYFTQIDGLVLIRSQTQVRLNESILIPAGTWTKGSVYTVNQYVTQQNQTGSAMPGNGYEFVCITPLSSGSFISYNPPYLDTNNWRAVQYIQIPSFEVKVATDIGGNIQLADSGSGYTPFTGYSPRHYRFSRDTRLGTLRRIWYGCKQTNDTTFDGGPAVEVIPTAGDILVVSAGSEPIQKSGDNSGPILDVR